MAAIDQQRIRIMAAMLIYLVATLIALALALGLAKIGKDAEK